MNQQDLEYWKSQASIYVDAYTELLKDYKALKKEKILDFKSSFLSPKSGDVLVLTAQRNFPKHLNAKSVAEEIQDWCTEMGIEIAPWFIFLEKGCTVESLPKDQLRKLLDE
jgi:hypothetical protein